MSNAPRTRLILILFALTSLRLAFHAWYVPAFEGPDEPFHLGRAISFASENWADAFHEEQLPASVDGAVAALPCGDALHDAFGCPKFGGAGAFNILAASPQRSGSPRRNYEAHQPPLYYAVAGALLAIAPAERVLSQLLVLRVFSLLCTIAALALLAVTSRRRSENFPLVLITILWLPGFSEALVRGSNDGLLFLWAATTWWAVEARKHVSLLIILAVIGPLLKLTAFPVIVAAAVVVWIARQRREAILVAVASCAVFPVQMLRGWKWGGTYEMNNATAAIDEPARSVAVGLVRSVYTFAKTIFWLGEWSFFRAPVVLVGAWFAILAASLVLMRLRRSERRAAHLVGVACASAGFVVLAVLNRKLFGTWGGLGGWYFWGWFPWLAFAGRDLFEVPPPRARYLAVAFVVFVVAANVLWFMKASTLYGWAP